MRRRCPLHSDGLPFVNPWTPERRPAVRGIEGLVTAPYSTFPRPWPARAGMAPVPQSPIRLLPPPLFISLPNLYLLPRAAVPAVPEPASASSPRAAVKASQAIQVPLVPAQLLPEVRIKANTLAVEAPVQVAACLGPKELSGGRVGLHGIEVRPVRGRPDGRRRRRVGKGRQRRGVRRRHGWEADRSGRALGGGARGGVAKRWRDEWAGGEAGGEMDRLGEKRQGGL